MRLSPLLALAVLAFAVLPTAAAAKGKTRPAAVENRCGWFLNPSPGNAWLIDRDGEWIVAIQSGHQADGDWPPPRSSEKEWVPAGGEGDPRGYGHGCVCMKVVTAPGHRIARILSGQGKPLAQCRRDRALTGLEPEHGSDE
ncbi:DUF4087 domain-containing protein [Lysobacter sp. K5869]|nr:DUF4087 domain-containing protein [Lysobacter sp. K5869]